MSVEWQLDCTQHSMYVPHIVSSLQSQSTCTRIRYSASPLSSSPYFVLPICSYTTTLLLSSHIKRARHNTVGSNNCKFQCITPTTTKQDHSKIIPKHMEWIGIKWLSHCVQLFCFYSTKLLKGRKNCLKSHKSCCLKVYERMPYLCLVNKVAAPWKQMPWLLILLAKNSSGHLPIAMNPPLQLNV